MNNKKRMVVRSLEIVGILQNAQVYRTINGLYTLHTALYQEYMNFLHNQKTKI